MKHNQTNYLAEAPIAFLKAKAFSLVELMTVISLAALVLAVTFPVFNSINRGTRLASSVNLLKGAMASAQMHATREVPDKEIRSESVNVPYQGGALLIDEIEDGDEVRLELTVMEHDQAARSSSSSGNRLLYNGYTGGEKRGYKPMGRLDPVKLPVGAGMVGIVRKSSGPTGTESEDEHYLKYVWPPFAIHFDDQGKIIAGTDGTGGQTTTLSGADYRVVVIDANSNGAYGERKDADATPAEDFHGPDDDNEILPAVSFVLLFDRTQYEAAGYESSALTNEFWLQHDKADQERKWLRDNGKILHMTRFSGVIMREDGVGETLVK